jgi:hypothetical protein
MGTTTAVESARRALGRLGVLLPVSMTSAPSADLQREAVPQLESAGYRAAWTNEVVGGKDAFVQLAVLLAATERMVIGTGIATQILTAGRRTTGEPPGRPGARRRTRAPLNSDSRCRNRSRATSDSLSVKGSPRETAKFTGDSGGQVVPPGCVAGAVSGWISAESPG